MELTLFSELGIRMNKNDCKPIENNKIVEQCIRIFRFEPHPRKKVIIMRGEITVTILDSDNKTIKHRCNEEFKKSVSLCGLHRSSNEKEIALDLFKKCPFLEEDSMLENLTEVVKELKSRQYDHNGLAVQEQAATDGSFLPRFLEMFDEFNVEECPDFQTDEEPDFGKVDQYIEMLYEDLVHKIEASKCFAKLTEGGCFLRDIARHGSAVNALFRTLREDSKNSSKLSKYILTVCGQFAQIQDFHEMLMNHKIPSLVLDIIDYELERYEKWKSQLVEIEENASNSETSSARSLNECRLMWLRLEELAALQNELLKEGFEILHCMSKECEVRKILYQQQVISSLIHALDRKDNNDLLFTVISLLGNLSCYKECIEKMKGLELIDKLADILKCGSPINKQIVKVSFHLLYNLSFDNTLRQNIYNCGLVHIILNCFGKPILLEITSKLLYNLSMEPSFRKCLAKSSLITSLMHLLISPDETQQPLKSILTGLAVNLAKTKGGAKLMWETNNLGTLVEMVLEEQDTFGMKIIRNVAEHNMAFVLYEKVGEISQALSISNCQKFILECICTLKYFDMSQVDISSITQDGRIFSWMKQTFGYYLEFIQKKTQLDDEFDLTIVVIDILLLLENIASVEEGARVVVGDGFMEILFKILHSQAETLDTQVTTDHIFIMFYTCTNHESISKYLASKTRFATDLLELAELFDGKLRKQCILILEQIGTFDETWKENIQQYNFLKWNKEWTDAASCLEDAEEEILQKFPIFDHDISFESNYEKASSQSFAEKTWTTSSNNQIHDDENIFKIFQHQFDEEMRHCKYNDDTDEDDESL